MNIDTAIIIPARYQSSRFPGKPLIDILGRSMIHRVWEQCKEVLPSTNIFVATDSEKIADHCSKNNIQALLTSSECLTGTDRVYEASKQIQAETIINVQGDEPLIDPEDIKKVIEEAKKYPSQIINAMCPILEEKDFRSINIPKVVFRKDFQLLYMSRAPIPIDKINSFSKAWKQVCIYAFPKIALQDFARESFKTPLEFLEDIEILRFLELGYDIKMIEVSTSSIAVDVPDDIARVERAIRFSSN
jgi:3-deoxy-manno-octulosonate cytidylyltransferase (CMP-KDO synthetase)